MKKINLLFLLITLLFLIPRSLEAYENTTNCSDRYVTFVNPVRGRDLWTDKTIKPLNNQYNILKKYSFPATWLLQYDVLKDPELIDEIGKFDENQEKGVFLEISEKLANDARVIYPQVPWYSPQAVFLSGYSQSDRRELINNLFENFKSRFGSYPKSVGAWWIDSYSLNYMKERYGIKSAVIVADQKTTDNYGVWGQWWGVPYYPAKANILTPASSLNNKLDVVITQWAQRHPVLAFGEGFKSSYSLQANDYTLLGEDVSFFKQLKDVYLDCKNPVGQITVGMETGMEGEKFINQYQEQLEDLSRINSLKAVTLGTFAGRFAKIYPNFPEHYQIRFDNTVWNLTTSSRSNQKLGETIYYSPQVSFNDYFMPDRTNFLTRVLPAKRDNNNQNLIWWLLLVLLLPLLFLKRITKKVKIALFFAGLLFWLAAFGLVLRSGYQYSWMVYYGPVFSNIDLIKPVLLLGSFLSIFLIYFGGKRYFSKNLYAIYLVCLAFGLDILVKILRFTYLSDKYYFGIILNKLRFIGAGISRPFGLEFVNRDLPLYQAQSWLKIDFNKIWENSWLSVVIYPLVHILSGLILIYTFSKSPPLLKKVITGVLVVLFVLYLMDIFGADPRIVL